MSDILDEIHVKNNGGVLTASVPCMAILSHEYSASLPSESLTFSEINLSLQQRTKDLFQKKDVRLQLPTGSAFNNCNGRWAEYVFGAYMWNALAAINSKSADKCRYIYIKLPTNSSISNNWIALLNENQYKELILFNLDESDPTVKASHHSGFRLCSSNPDAVILSFSEDNCPDFDLDPMCPITDLSVNTINRIDRMFEIAQHKVDISSNLKCFVSIKTSTRPDRRYQFVHEGDSIKAILMHLSVSTHLKLNLSPKYFSKKYFCFSLSKINNADRKAMDTASTACISSPGLSHIWCVDALNEVCKPNSIAGYLKSML